MMNSHRRLTERSDSDHNSHAKCYGRYSLRRRQGGPRTGDFVARPAAAQATERTEWWNLEINLRRDHLTFYKQTNFSNNLTSIFLSFDWKQLGTNHFTEAARQSTCSM